MHTSKDVRLYAAVVGTIAIAAVLAIMLVAPPPRISDAQTRDSCNINANNIIKEKNGANITLRLPPLPNHCRVHYFLTPFQNSSYSYIGGGDTLNFDVAAHTEKVRAVPTHTAINANGQLKYINTAGGEYKVKTNNSAASFDGAATATSSEIAQYKIMATRVAKARSHLSVADENGNVTIRVQIVCTPIHGYCEEGKMVTNRNVTVQLDPTGVDALPTRVSAQSNLAKPRKAPPGPAATFTPTPTPTPTQIVIQVQPPKPPQPQKIVVDIKEEEPVPEKREENGNEQPQENVEVPVAPPPPTATNTPAPTATNTPVPTATNTPIPTATNTPAPTATNTPVPTPTATPETVDTDKSGCVSSAEYAAAAQSASKDNWNVDITARFHAIRAAYLANPC